MTIGLPTGLAVVMFGLGLSLTPRDFARVLTQPKAVVVALVCQLLVLPTICFGLVLALQLPPVLAVGMMVLAASPGGAAANLYSHLFRGDVALNISLTAVNSVLAVLTLPLITNFALWYFEPFDDRLGMQWAKAVEVFAIVLVPVVIGMLVRRGWPHFADRMDRPVRVVSVLVLILVVAAAVASNWVLLRDNFLDLALITIVFCLVSLSIGYVVPRWFRIGRRQAISTSFEIGMHNATLAIVVAQTVLDSVALSLPAAVYGVLMFFLACGFGFLVRGRGGADAAADDPVGRHHSPADSAGS
ncbi:bile acid:Na+ symporter, BASS family [Microbacterium pygmaeum]|uniref:Bile acid:Na+ symporter, BASS family n=2 Tax=Microbacterium pygmaeum TaxID=370764 RepID=A0A1G7X5D9_9MICO|nr:bile acid:Na+ symporter, BASS family [Microbacterium pygmaeum]